MQAEHKTGNCSENTRWVPQCERLRYRDQCCLEINRISQVALSLKRKNSHDERTFVVAERMKGGRGAGRAKRGLLRSAVADSPHRSLVDMLCEGSRLHAVQDGGISEGRRDYNPRELAQSG